MTDRDLLALLIVGGLTGAVTLVFQLKISGALDSAAVAAGLWLMYRIGKNGNRQG